MVHFNLCSFNEILYKSLDEKILDHTSAELNEVTRAVLRSDDSVMSRKDMLSKDDVGFVRMSVGLRKNYKYLPFSHNS
jgi:hypothetical protein